MEIAKERDGSLFSDSRHCFGGEPQDKLILNYSLAFQRLFRDRPHFAFTFLTGSTHGSDLNSPSQVDDYHARHLTSLVKEGLVNNTLLIFFSDHGIRWGEFRSTPLGKLEDVRPFMFLVFPEWFPHQPPRQDATRSTERRPPDNAYRHIRYPA
ncbi:hypothetical protein BaRGS_00038343 [Batillaria attramentaria]|uniref:Sulfatase N-terminal domain-containing protein n=1 Tax=Batillaria attramentaria TaxID=370345 RepID=A0ABD0J6F4_9CAEN